MGTIKALLFIAMKFYGIPNLCLMRISCVFQKKMKFSILYYRKHSFQFLYRQNTKIPCLTLSVNPFALSVDMFLL